jgi:hypothetical protein|tara:strand:+ start:1167 stop:2075 length:909 start_codon:yes stop_codon:yes gene_type:complete
MSDNEILAGELREPKQMLAEQEYSGHLSIHDDEMAAKLGFQAGPIEGPTHFSQFVPLLVELWGNQWLEQGCLSSHFLNMCFEGDQVRPFVEMPDAGKNITRIWAEKADGTPVLAGTASIPDTNGVYPESELDARVARLTSPGPLKILKNLTVGMRGKVADTIRMDFEQNMGKLYPFSLKQKLDVITETLPAYDPATAADTTWTRAIIPLEMISVLAEYSSDQAAWPVNGPAVGLFADLEIKVTDGPLLVGEDYMIEREIACISESRRTESYWVRSTIKDPSTGKVKAEVLLNHASLKDTYAG